MPMHKYKYRNTIVVTLKECSTSGDPGLALGGSSLTLDIEEIGRLGEALPLISAFPQI